MTTTRITLRNFKHDSRASEETVAFTADVCLDGVLVGHASNRGRGGMTLVRYASPEAKATAETYAATISPLNVKGWEFLADTGFTFDVLVDLAVEAKVA